MIQLALFLFFTVANSETLQTPAQNTEPRPSLSQLTLAVRTFARSESSRATQFIESTLPVIQLATYEPGLGLMPKQRRTVHLRTSVTPVTTRPN